MISVQPTCDFNLIKSILTTPDLYEEISDIDSVPAKDFQPNKNNLYLLATNDSDILGVSIVQPLSSISAQVHINILPKFWGKRLDEIALLSIEWLKANTKLVKLISLIPEECRVVAEACKRYGFDQEGFIKNSINRKNKLQGQYIFGFEIKRN